ncbi:MAG: glycosyltransferase family 2 protein [Bacteroidales bacterium]
MEYWVYIAYFILVFQGIQCFISLINVLFHYKFHAKSTQSNDLVSVLIPARNEERNIEECIRCVLQQEYKTIEVLIYDDESKDRTAEIVNTISLEDKRVKLIKAEKLPAGWLGKNYACDVLYRNSKGKYLLFLDADVRIKGSIINECISYQKKYKLSLISLFPKQEVQTKDEIITVPVMFDVLLTLLPLVLVRKSGFVSLSAANGQFMFFDKPIYSALELHKYFKNNRVEDIAIARYLKKQGYKIACLLADERVTCRMYENYNDAVNGFSKNVKQFFGGSHIVALLYWFISTFGLVIVFVSTGLLETLLLLSFIILTRIFVSIVSHQNILYNILYYWHRQGSLGIFIYRSIKNSIKKEQSWKERNTYI